MLFSRAIRLRSLKEGETLAMVPYADLINHSPSPNSNWTTVKSKPILKTIKNIKKDQEITIDYGLNGNLASKLRLKLCLCSQI